MRLAYLCKRRYMGKDVILDRYARVYEIARQFADRGHEVHGYCLDYHSREDGVWAEELSTGTLRWESYAIGGASLPRLAIYPARLLRKLRKIRPHALVCGTDIPHVALGGWLAHTLGIPHIVDLYDNFEGFSQGRIPGMVSLLRNGARKATLITTVSEPLRQYVVDRYRPQAKVMAIPSSVDKTVFRPMDKRESRILLNLPADAKLIGTAGGLYREKGIEPLFEAWNKTLSTIADVHLVLAGPTEPGLPLPTGDRVHYLGKLGHDRVATLFNALDVGVISVLDSDFGRFSFPQKAYEMLACQLCAVASDVGAMSSLFADVPQYLVEPGDAASMAKAILQALEERKHSRSPVPDWKTSLAPLVDHLEAGCT